MPKHDCEECRHLCSKPATFFEPEEIWCDLDMEEFYDENAECEEFDWFDAEDDYWDKYNWDEHNWEASIGK